MSPAFTSTYGGTCASCDSRFPAGTRVCYDIHNEIVHEACPDPVAAARPVCGVCFMETSTTGACGCES